MKVHNWLLVMCALLAVCDVRWLGIGVRGDEISPGEDRSEKRIPGRRKATPSDPFDYRPVPVPVRVKCEKPKTAESCTAKKPVATCEDRLVINDLLEKQRTRDECRRMTAAAAAAVPAAEKRAGEGVTGSKAPPGAVAADCEQCEIQIKADGEGILLRCRKCRPANVEGMRFPNAGPDKVVHLP